MPRLRDEISDGATVVPPIDAKPDNDKRRRKRIQVYLNDDGSPDWEATPAEVRNQLGGKLPSEAEPPKTIDIPPETFGMLMGMVANIEAAIVAKKMDLPSEAAAACFIPPQPIADGINQAGAKVLSKYSGSMGRWADEIALGCLLITWQTAAFNQIRQLQASMPKPEPPTQTVKE